MYFGLKFSLNAEPTYGSLKSLQLTRQIPLKPVKYILPPTAYFFSGFAHKFILTDQIVLEYVASFRFTFT